MKFLHSMIRVKDIDASLKFYTELLWMHLEHKKRLEDCELYFLNDETNTVQIELTYNDETPENGYENGTCFGHFAFACDSFDKFTKTFAIYSAGILYAVKKTFRWSKNSVIWAGRIGTRY